MWYGPEKISDYPDITHVTYDYYAFHKEHKLTKVKLGKDWYVHNNTLYVAVFKEGLTTTGSYRIDKKYVDSDDLIEVNSCV